MSLIALHRLERIDELDRHLAKAASTLDNVIGRSQVDNRGIGAAQFLIEGTRKSLAAIRESIAADARAEAP